MDQKPNLPEQINKLYRKKPVVIEATQWFKNGDHPEDYARDHEGLEGGELRIFTGAERKANGWEGDVVRYYRRPDVPGESLCEQCGKPHHVHGWIDTLEQGHRVCPGDWIITGVKGERYPCKPDIFAATYEPAALSAPPAQEPVAYIDPTTFAALRRFTDRGGVLTTITPHRAFPDDVPLYASPLPQEPQEGKELTDSDAGLTAAWKVLHDETIPASNRYIRAIKAYREATGALLKEAKDAVDDLQSGRVRPPAWRELRGAQEGKAGEWIPVSERLPEIGTDCLVWTRPSWAREPYALVDRWDEQHEAPVSWSSATIPIGPGWDSSAFDDVTHWMPLPPPPSATLAASREGEQR